MPLVTITRDSNLMPDEKMRLLRDGITVAVSVVLCVEVSQVEVRVREFHALDINVAPIGIEIETGLGKWWWRLWQRKRLGRDIEQRVRESAVIPQDLLNDARPYVWLKVYGSSFVPIGYPRFAR